MPRDCGIKRTLELGWETEDMSKKKRNFLEMGLESERRSLDEAGGPQGQTRIIRSQGDELG